MSHLVLADAAYQTLKISVPTVAAAARGRLSSGACDDRLRSWAGNLLQRVAADLEVFGLENVDSSLGPYIVVSNHQSHYDIPVLYSALPLSLRMAAKKEFFDIPVWGRALTASGFVAIDRSRPKIAYRELRVAAAKLKEEALSLFVAPEGTRSSDGSVGPFKRGAFDLARVMKMPILPVALSGTFNIHRKGSRRCHSGQQVIVRVLPAVAPADFGKGLPERVRETIVQAL